MIKGKSSERTGPRSLHHTDTGKGSGPWEGLSHWGQEMEGLTYHVLTGRHEEQRQALIQRFPQKSLSLIHPVVMVEVGRGRHQEQIWKKETEPCDSVKVGDPSCWALNFITQLPSLSSV